VRVLLIIICPSSLNRPNKKKSYRFRYGERGGQNPLACFSGTETNTLEKVRSSLKILAEKCQRFSRNRRCGKKNGVKINVKYSFKFSYSEKSWFSYPSCKHSTPHTYLNPLNPELNPICYLLALLGAHHFLHVSRIRVKLLTFRLLMSHIYIYGAPILDVSRSHTTTQHSR